MISHGLITFTPLIMKYECFNKTSIQYFVIYIHGHGHVHVYLYFLLYYTVSISYKRLQETGIGCHMGHRFSGALAYADDITLMSPSRSGMAILVKVCEKYAVEYDIIFNSKKVNYYILEVDIVVQSIKELKLTDNM